MSYEEKSAWVMGVLAVVMYALYTVVVLGRADGGSLTAVAYQAPMLWAIGLTLVAAILIHLAIVITSPAEARRADQRDKEIGRFGDHIGQSFVVIGGNAALLMALAEWDYFWIANVIYLTFVLAAVLGSVAKVVAYRWGLPW